MTKKHKSTIKIDIVKELKKQLVKDSEGKFEVPKQKNNN